MSFSEGETSYICIHGANISALLTSFAIAPDFTFGLCVDSFSFKMSRISYHTSVSDSFTVLLDDSWKENQSLWEQLRQRDEENALNFEELSNKVDSFRKLVAENNSDSKETKSKKDNSKVHVPTSSAKPMTHFVYLCKNIFIYNICIFQFLSSVYKPLATLLWKLQNQVKELWQ